jgi:hypothetical protein
MSMLTFLPSFSQCLFSFYARLSLSTDSINSRFGTMTFLILLDWRWPMKCHLMSSGS